MKKMPVHFNLSSVDGIYLPGQSSLAQLMRNTRMSGDKNNDLSQFDTVIGKSGMFLNLLGIYLD